MPSAGKRFIEMVEAHLGRGRREPEDEIEELERKELERLALEAKKLRIRELIAEKQKRLAELEGSSQQGDIGLPTGGAQPAQSNIVASLIAALVAQGLKPEEVNEYLKKLSPEVIAAMSAASQGNPMLPFLMYAMTKGSPQSITVRDVVEIADKMRGTPQADMSKLIEFLLKERESMATSPMVLFKEVVLPLKDEVAKAREQALMTAMEEMKKKLDRLENQPGIVEQLIHKRDELEALRQLFGGEGGGTDKDLELKKILLDHERWKTEKEIELRKWEVERASEREKLMTAIKNVVAPLLGRALPALEVLAKGMTAKVGQPMAVGSMGGMGPVAQQILLPCENCKTLIPISPPFPDEVRCPNCGAIHRKQAPSSPLAPRSAPSMPSISSSPSPSPPPSPPQPKRGMVIDRTEFAGKGDNKGDSEQGSA